MRRLSVIIAVGLLAGCSDEAMIADEAMASMASQLGKLTADVEFTDLHVRAESVCGYADGQRFYSLVSAGNRMSILVDQDEPDAMKEVVVQSFFTCMNEGQRIDEK